MSFWPCFHGPCGVAIESNRRRLATHFYSTAKLGNGLMAAVHSILPVEYYEIQMPKNRKDQAAPTGDAAKGKQVTEVVVWTNRYGANKTKIFSTTLGHNNETVADERYLDLVTRGLLWTLDKLDEDGKPTAGYGK